MTATHRKKPVEIEARQWNSIEEINDLMEWTEDSLSYDEEVSGPSDPLTGEDWGLLNVDTMEGSMTVTPRDWIIKGVEGEFYACKPSIFDKTYEEI